MIVILEGPNRVGKTTLSNKMQEIGFKYFKDLNVENVMKTDIDKKAFYKGRIIATLEMLKYININLVIDRFHISEFVYGLIERNYICDYMVNIDKLLKQLDIKLIYLTDDIQSINQRANRDLTKHKLAFDLFYSISTVDKMQYNLKEDIIKVIDFLQLTNVKPIRKE